MKRIAWGLAFVAAVGLAGLAAQAEDEPVKLLKVGDKLTDFTLSDVDGKTHKIADFKGKVVVFNLFAFS